MLIWAAFIVAGFLCAPLLRWPGFVITTVLVAILYWLVVGVQTPTAFSYAVNFVLIAIAMQIGYVVGLLVTAKIAHFRHNVADLGKRHSAARVKKGPDEPGSIRPRIGTGSAPRGE